MQTQETAPQPRLRLTEARNRRGWSQQEVANRLGTTHVNVSRWERGITKPSPYFRRKLCSLFGKTEQELDLDALPETLEPEPALPASPELQHTVLYDPAIPLLPAIQLIGRENDLARIKQRLRTGGSVGLTALNGLPGVGKTAISIALAHDAEIRSHFRDGILWAGLGPDPNMPGLLSRWGTLLGLSASQMAALNDTEAWAKAIRTAIGSRYMLLVIDDAWKLEEALTFKVGGPNCAHLVTTRFPNIAAHIAVEGAMLLRELSTEESMSLLRLLAPTVVNREEQKAHDLVQAVGGLPLALTLIGNYLRKQAYSGQTRRINTALEHLSDAEERLHISEPHAPVETHPSLSIDTPLSLRSVIAVTDQLLPEQARKALYALSVFPAKPNTFSEEAALAVIACPVDVLDALVDTGLLESSGSDRYTLHQIIADYARIHLNELAPHERLIVFATNYVEKHKKDYELLELESSTILAALEIAHALGRQTELVRAVSAFAPFLLLRGFYQLAEHHVQRAYTAAQATGNYYDIVSVLLHMGQVAQKQGKFTQAATFFQEGLALAREINDNERICALLNDLGWVTWRRGEYAQAEAYLQEGLTIARQIGNQERIIGLLKILGSVVGSRGDYAQSAQHLQEGLALARQLGDREQICALLINLGTTIGEQGNHAQAESYFQEGLLLARQIGHREGMSALLINLGGAAAAQGHYSQAETYLQEGLVLARELGHREWVTILLLNLGEIAIAQGDAAQAERYLQETLTLAKQIGRPQITAKALYEFGNLHLSQSRLEAARISFTEMVAVIPEGSQELRALAHYGLARVAAAQGDVQEAHSLGETSVTVLETMGHRNAQEVRNWLEALE